MGIAAIQIAKLFHCRVITTAGDEAKLEKGRELGADYGINHYKQKISEEVRKITNKEGVDIVVEHVGAATWDESVKSLKSRRHAGDLRRDHWTERRDRSAASVRAPVDAARLLHGNHGRTA